MNDDTTAAIRLHAHRIESVGVDSRTLAIMAMTPDEHIAAASRLLAVSVYAPYEVEANLLARAQAHAALAQAKRNA